MMGQPSQPMLGQGPPGHSQVETGAGTLSDVTVSLWGTSWEMLLKPHQALKRRGYLQTVFPICGV